jgi:MFS family permease
MRGVFLRMILGAVLGFGLVVGFIVLSEAMSKPPPSPGPLTIINDMAKGLAVAFWLIVGPILGALVGTVYGAWRLRASKSQASASDELQRLREENTCLRRELESGKDRAEEGPS